MFVCSYGFIEHVLCARYHAKDIKVKDINLAFRTPE